jgi:hypothetical protein
MSKYLIRWILIGSQLELFLLLAGIEIKELQLLMWSVTKNYVDVGFDVSFAS